MLGFESHAVASGEFYRRWTGERLGGTGESGVRDAAAGGTPGGQHGPARRRVDIGPVRRGPGVQPGRDPGHRHGGRFSQLAGARSDQADRPRGISAVFHDHGASVERQHRPADRGGRFLCGPERSLLRRMLGQVRRFAVPEGSPSSGRRHVERQESVARPGAASLGPARRHLRHRGGGLLDRVDG